MSNNAVINQIRNKLGSTHATNYKNSESCFNAKIETSLKGDYFIESSRFEGSDRILQPKEYCLKCIGESHVYKVIEFKSRSEAFDFFDSIEFLPSGALVLERSLTNHDLFIKEQNEKVHAENMYDGAYSAAYKIWSESIICTYTEGDFAKLHFSSKELFNSEVESYISFNKEG